VSSGRSAEHCGILQGLAGAPDDGDASGDQGHPEKRERRRKRPTSRTRMRGLCPERMRVTLSSAASSPAYCSERCGEGAWTWSRWKAQRRYRKTRAGQQERKWGYLLEAHPSSPRREGIAGLNPHLVPDAALWPVTFGSKATPGEFVLSTRVIMFHAAKSAFHYFSQMPGRIRLLQETGHTTRLKPADSLGFTEAA
jgi:hypothetical protein